jgi:hypothetical protein
MAPLFFVRNTPKPSSGARRWRSYLESIILSIVNNGSRLNLSVYVSAIAIHLPNRRLKTLADMRIVGECLPWSE